MALSSVSSSAASEKFSFSPNCQDWALTTNDGRLTVWDSETGRIKQEFIPSAHLSSACTCLAWMPASEQDSRKKKSRKRKSSLSNGTNGHSDHHNDVASHRSDTIAVGTSSGTVFIYSLKTGAVVAQFTADKAHSDRINDIAWNSTCTQIFTASSDGYFGQYNVKKSLFIGKFKCDEGTKTNPIYSICVHPSDSSIITGSVAKITWWDMDTVSPLKTFSGTHLGPVTILTTLTIDAGRCVLVSGGSSEQDHTLAVWNLSLEKTDVVKADDETVVARFSVNETVRSVSASCTDESSITLAAVTRSGSLLCFDHNLHERPGKKKRKPIKARATVQIASEKDSSGKVRSIPILDGRLINDDDNLSIKLAHGNQIRPVFENVSYDTLEPVTCLVRQQAAAKSQQTTAAGSSNLVVPKTTSAHLLAPGPSMTEKTAGTPGARKRKQSIGDNHDNVAMVDRLRLLSREGDSTTTPPRADSMLQLLLQGLNNKDRKILNSVLDRADDDLIEKTVKRLPVDAVMPLIAELQQYIKGRGMVNQSHSKWLRSVLQIHTAHLISTPECPELLGPVYAMLEARTKHYGKLLQLKGKLDMMTRQISALPDDQTNVQPSKEALLVYRDDSSDELSEVLDDLLLPASDTEDIWQQPDDAEQDDEGESEDEEEEEEDDDDDEQVEQIEISSDSDGGENGVVNGNGTDVSMDSD